MRIYLQPPQPSRGLQRIADALVKYKPEWVEVVGSANDADLVVIYAIGRNGHVQRQAETYKKIGITYAVIQVCLRSTLNPWVPDWMDLWADSVLVWSYYDLRQAWVNDTGTEEWQFDNIVPFYHAPLGVESEVFYYRGRNSDTNYDYQYIIATSGLSRLSESVRECNLAARIAGGAPFHLGPQVIPGVVSRSGISDDKLAGYYSQCEFVSALRRKEGFELPAAEGLLCGARPIAFDTPDYRWAYKDWAEYIHEGTRQEVVDQLVELFRRGARPVTEAEIEAARKWLHWPTIINGFYERLR